MNKKIMSLFVLIALCVSLTVFVVMSDQPSAEGDDVAVSGKQISLVVLDVQGVLNTSDASEKIKEQAKKMAEAYQKELVKLEEDLRKSQQEILKETKDKSTDVKVKARQGFEKELVAANKTANEKRRALEKAVDTATQELRQKILEIVATMSAKNGYDVVLSHQDVVIASKKFDITQVVMDQLNKELKTIELKVE